MKLLPVKLRYECSTYYCALYIKLNDSYYGWPPNVDRHFQDGYLVEPKDGQDYKDWVKYL